MSKSIKLKNNTFWDSSSIIHKTNGNFNRRILSKYLPSNQSGTASYNTRFLQLGYINCSLSQNYGWTNITLLISSSFYGVQHWSTHLLTLAQSQYVKANYLKLGGNNREFYYKIDTANSRIYFYASCTGGNGFGNWNTKLLNDLNCEWVNEIITNVNKTDDWVEILAV